MMLHDHYTYRVTWSAEDEEFVGLCAEFSLLSWLAATPDEAFAGIRALVSDCVADMEAEGEPLQEPRPTATTAEGSWCECRRKPTAPWR